MNVLSVQDRRGAEGFRIQVTTKFHAMCTVPVCVSDKGCCLLLLSRKNLSPVDQVELHPVASMQNVIIRRTCSNLGNPRDIPKVPFQRTNRVSLLNKARQPVCRKTVGPGCREKKRFSQSGSVSIDNEMRWMFTIHYCQEVYFQHCSTFQTFQTNLSCL